MAKQWGWNYGKDQSKNKYHNVKWEIDGEKFDSQKEARRYTELKLLERVGQIKNLRRQVPFELIPNQYDENKKLIERKTSYIADFVYEEGGQLIVEDVKGLKQGPAYSLFTLKRKMMLYFHGIKVREI